MARAVRVAGADDPVSEQMATLAESSIAELRARTFEQLVSLPKVESRELRIENEPVRINTYCERESPEDVFVVVQVARQRWWGIFTQLNVKGFIASANGATIDAPEQMLWEFI